MQNRWEHCYYDAADENLEGHSTIGLSLFWQGKGAFHSGCFLGGNRCGNAAEINVQYFSEDLGRMHADCERSLHLRAALSHSARVPAAGHAQVQQGESPVLLARSRVNGKWKC